MTRSWRAKIPPEALRFLVAGGISSLVNWLSRFPLSTLFTFDIAVALAYGSGMVIGFWLYKIWVFPGSILSLRAQLVRFVAVNALGLLVVVASADLLSKTFQFVGIAPTALSYSVAHAISIAFGAVVNFYGHRFMTFARSVVSGRSAIAASRHRLRMPMR
jgi:putative flippase GtrA